MNSEVKTETETGSNADLRVGKSKLIENFE
jgi:hypothetical protein